jgi:hypothetical protein
MIRAKVLIRAFIALAAIGPSVFLLANGYGGDDGGNAVANGAFVVGLLLEVVAFLGASGVRRDFDPDDAWRTVWTLIAAFLGVRILAELRLATLLFGLVPFHYEGAPTWLFVYVVVFRYLYTVSDLLFLWALVLTIRSYKDSGFDFRVTPRDYAFMAPLVIAPVIAYELRHMLTLTGDTYLTGYRLVAVTINMALACLCIVVRRYALQMGGGAVARVWTAVVLATAARVASFVSVAVVAQLLPTGAIVASDFVEQYLITIFAACWVLAIVYQRDVRRRASGAPGTTMDGSLGG